MEQNKARTYRIWAIIFLVVGLLGVIDIATRDIVQQDYSINDVGYISLGVFTFLKFIFGSEIASNVITFIFIILDLSLIWIILSIFMDRKSRKK